MMTKPGITELDRCVDSRYTLVTVVAKRARMIGMERNEEDVPYDEHAEKPVTQAVNEISNGIVGYVRSDAVKKAQEYVEEKLEAISQLHEAIAEESVAEHAHEETVSAEAEEASEGAAPGMYDDPTVSDSEEEEYTGVLDAALAEAEAAARAAAEKEAEKENETNGNEGE